MRGSDHVDPEQGRDCNGHETSAGITAGIDLCRALVESDHGAELARDVARHLVVFMQRPGGQAQFSVRLDLATTTSGPLRDVLDEIAGDPTADHSLEALSDRAGFSVRHLTRVFQRELGLTPGRYVEGVRVEAAKARLQRSDEPLAASPARPASVRRRPCAGRSGASSPRRPRPTASGSAPPG